MSVYHIMNGQLTRLCEDIRELAEPELRGTDDFWEMVDWAQTDEVEGAYVLYEPRGVGSVSTALTWCAYAFQVEDGTGEFPWTVLIRDDLVEFLEMMRLLQPLFARTTYLELETEIRRRLDMEDRARRAPDFC
ncbi:MAG: hypothetical protein ACQEXC_14170 [Pseudomonadota bacterium]